MTRRNDLPALFVILAFCALMFPTAAIFVEATAGGEISPRFWPNLALSIAALGTAAAIGKSFKDGNRLNPSEFFKVSGESKKQFLFMLMAVVYIKAMEYVGFFVASLAMLPTLMFYFGYRNKALAPIISFFFIGILFAVFSKIFRISFPAWVLGG